MITTAYLLNVKIMRLLVKELQDTVVAHHHAGQAALKVITTAYLLNVKIMRLLVKELQDTVVAHHHAGQAVLKQVSLHVIIK